ncbi:MAG: hypothetical protein EOO51_09430 [Flavobacterium sp.]|nr:MAG: hypothetical protein EOO51_09430 [Flavobacterium sp.]
MSKPKIYKILTIAFGALAVAALVIYSQLPNRHKAIIKTEILHRLHIVESDWEVGTGNGEYRMISPSFLIDGIYKSMEGPKSSNYVQLSQDSTLLWLTGFSVKALSAKTRKQISNDFICHTNVDFNDARYYSEFGLTDRIGKQYPRMTSLSHGLEHFSFPKGYGVPMRGNDLLYVTTQSLNHNIPDTNFVIRHEVSIKYFRGNRPMKPLMSRTAFIMLPYDKDHPYSAPLDKGADMCVPVETKNHSYDDGHGNMMSGHWVIPPGRRTYRSNANGQLQIADSLRLHAAAIHVHPFAESITLFDKTAGKAIFTSHIKNHKGKIGLSNIEQFRSEAGVWLYANHDYELVMQTNNTSATNQDMMGSMFLFFYDKQLDHIINGK